MSSTEPKNPMGRGRSLGLGDAEVSNDRILEVLVVESSVF